MRIALAGDLCTFPTDYGKQTLELGSWLVRRGHVVANFGLQHVGPPREVEGVHVIAFNDAYARESAFSTFRPDVTVHIRDNWVLSEESAAKPYHLMPIAHRFGGKFMAYTPVDHDYYPDFFVDTVSSEADLTTVTTDWGLEVLTRCGAPRTRMRRLYPGVNPDIYHAGKAEPETLDRFGLPSDVPLFVQVATNWSTGRKMQPLLILAFKSFLERYDSDAILYLHSPSEGFFRLEEIVKAAGLWGKGRIALRSGAGFSGHTIGMTEGDMAGLYRSATAVVSLTTAEGFNSPMAEAASCGTPTIMTDFPVHREVLSHWDEFHSSFLVRSRQDTRIN